MIDKKDLIKFQSIFPQAKKFKPHNRQEAIELAKEVAISLEAEKKWLIDEQKNSDSSKLLSTSFH